MASSLKWVGARGPLKVVLILFLVLGLSLQQADAASKKKKKKKKRKPSITLVTPEQLFQSKVKVKVGSKKKKKKFKTVTVQCFGSTAGVVKQVKQGLSFISYAKTLKNLKKKNASPAKIQLYKALSKAGRAGCLKPPFLDMDPYKGDFGPAEARMLFSRFGLGASPEQVNLAVSEGLDRTVDRLTTFIAEPNIDGVVADLNCDARFADDPKNEQCDPQNPNDLDPRGIRYGLYFKFRHSQNQFFNRLFLFLHDERMAASVDVLGGSEGHAILEYIGMLERAARSGDYVQYLRDANKDHLLHIKYLDGGANRGYAPNENYAREFWELGTVGPSDLDGNPNYTDQDIAQSALAFSGWDLVSNEIFGNWVTYPAFVQGLHAPGPKFVWGQYVDSADDILRITLNHPRLAEHLAEDIWKQFINPELRPQGIRRLASVIRDNNFNLIPVFKRVMKSKALFAAESRKTLVKHPYELLIGFLRQTNYPASPSTIDYYMSRMGQTVTRPPTVFGWDEKKLAGEAYVLEWRNTVVGLTNESPESLLEDDNYSLYDRFLVGLSSAASPSLAAVDRVADFLDIKLNDAQRSQLDQFLNYDRRICQYYDKNCTRGEYFLDRDVFDPDPQGGAETKLQGLITILAELPNYRMK